MEITVNDNIWDSWLELYGVNAEKELQAMLRRVANRGKGGKVRTTLLLTEDHAEFLKAYCFLNGKSRTDLISELIMQLPVEQSEKAVKTVSTQPKAVTIHFEPHVSVYRYLSKVAAAKNCSHALIVEKAVNDFRGGISKADLRVILTMITRKRSAEIEELAG